ncbi:HalOD1 output domain-containing protein [Halovenus amylolytica]|uniref:HalOD1 output domain-containing protein n=1 Tax=Halovenus amylolytica TaxID=2500550 RepID=UPI00361CA3F2
MTVINIDELNRGEITYLVSESIADQTDADICELPPLHETIDPDALDTFLRCSNSTDAHPERSVELSLW